MLSSWIKKTGMAMLVVAAPLSAALAAPHDKQQAAADGELRLETLIGMVDSSRIGEARKFCAAAAKDPKTIEHEEDIPELAEYCVLGDNLDAAHALLRLSSKLPQEPGVIRKRAKAAQRLAITLADGVNLPEALEVYREMSEMGDSAVVIDARAQTAESLVFFALRDKKDTKTATELYGDLKNMPDSEDIIDRRALAATSLSRAWANKESWKEAKALVAEIDALPKTDEVQRQRITARLNLVNIMIGKGLLDEARAIYRDAPDYDADDDENLLAKARIGALLIKAYMQKGKKSDARAVFETMEPLGDSDGVNEVREYAASLIKG